MTIESLKDLVGAQPFRSFTMHLADGRKITVKHPDFFSRSPSGRTIIVHSPDERFEVIDLLLVVSCEVGNGKRRQADKN